MTFLLDENFPLSTMELLASRGHVGIPLAEACGLGVSDEEVFGQLNKEAPFFLRRIAISSIRFLFSIQGTTALSSLP